MTVATADRPHLTFKTSQAFYPGFPPRSATIWLGDLKDLTDNIRKWLEGHGLDKYVEAFVENEIDFETLPRLDTENLKKLGLPIGSGPGRGLVEGIDWPRHLGETKAAKVVRRDAGRVDADLTLGEAAEVGPPGDRSRT